MKTTWAYKIWQILYPVGMYYVVEGIVFFCLELILGSDNETYMLRQTLGAAATIPVIGSWYAAEKRIRENVYGKRPVKWGRELAGNLAVAFLGVAPLAMAVNNLIAMTPLMEVSGGFETANGNFFAGRLIYELLGSCLVIPVAEELLFRGVVYGRLKLLFAASEAGRGASRALPPAADAFGIFGAARIAAVLSALLFGLVHFNLVQFLYAGLLGLVLALLYEKSGFLYVPVLGHIAANLAAVLRAETGALAFSYEPTAAGIGVTAALAAVGVGSIIFYVRKKRKDI